MYETYTLSGQLRVSDVTSLYFYPRNVLVLRDKQFMKFRKCHFDIKALCVSCKFIINLPLMPFIIPYKSWAVDVRAFPSHLI